MLWSMETGSALTLGQGLGLGLILTSHFSVLTSTSLCAVLLRELFILDLLLFHEHFASCELLLVSGELLESAELLLDLFSFLEPPYLLEPNLLLVELLLLSGIPSLLSSAYASLILQLFARLRAQ